MRLSYLLGEVAWNDTMTLQPPKVLLNSLTCHTFVKLCHQKYFNPHFFSHRLQFRIFICKSEASLPYAMEA
jgi:hypothetical protein